MRSLPLFVHVCPGDFYTQNWLPIARAPAIYIGPFRASPWQEAAMTSGTLCAATKWASRKKQPEQRSTFHSAMHLIVQRKLSKSWCAVKLLRTLAPSSVELHGTRRPLGGLERRTEAHRMIASSKCWLGCVFSRSRQKGIGGSGYILSVSDSH